MRSDETQGLYVQVRHLGEYREQRGGGHRDARTEGGGGRGPGHHGETLVLEDQEIGGAELAVEANAAGRPRDPTRAEGRPTSLRAPRVDSASVGRTGP